MGCSACVLAADLYKQQGQLDRRAALTAVQTFLAKNAELPAEDRAVPEAKAVNDAANAILLRARSGDSVTVFAPDAFDLAEMSSIKMRSFFSSASARGVPATLVLIPNSFNNLGEVERRSLRDAAIRNDFQLALGEAERGRFGVSPASSGSRKSSTGLGSADRQSTGGWPRASFRSPCS